MLHRPGRSYTPRALGAGRSPRWGENVVRRALLGKCDFCAGCPWAEAGPPRSGDLHNTSTSTPAMWSGARSTERAGAVSDEKSFLVFVEIRKCGAVPFQSVQSVQSVQFSSVQFSYVVKLGGPGRGRRGLWAAQGESRARQSGAKGLTLSVTAGIAGFTPLSGPDRPRPGTGE